jgi:hypothetical protein
MLFHLWHFKLLQNSIKNPFLLLLTWFIQQKSIIYLFTLKWVAFSYWQGSSTIEKKGEILKFYRFFFVNLNLHYFIIMYRSNEIVFCERSFNLIKYYFIGNSIFVRRYAIDFNLWILIGFFSFLSFKYED